MSTPDFSNPVLLLESRYWVLNARLNAPVPSSEQLTAIAGRFKGAMLTGHDLLFDLVRHPLDNYTDETTLLRITVKQEVVDRLHGEYCSRWSELRLKSISFYLTDLEMLCCYAGFEVASSMNIKTLEEEGMGLVDIISSLQPDLELLFRSFEAEGMVSTTADMLFGVPGTLRKSGLHTPDNSYLYSWHLFFPGNRDRLMQTVADYNLEECGFPYCGDRIYPGWALVLWDVADRPGSFDEMINKVFIDSLSMSEAVMYDNSIYCFTGFLDQIIRDQKVDSNRIRQVCNISHLVLQRIKLWKRNLSVEQQVYHERLRSVLMLEQKIADFDSSESTLIKAVEGVEVKQSQKSGRIIELVLSFFTALSLYSVANDFYSIMITDGSVKPINLFSVRTMLIFLATGIVVGFFYLLRKARKE